MKERLSNWSLAVAVTALVIGLTVSVVPRSVVADQVVPGGRAAKIWSFVGTASPNQYGMVIASTPGDHGFIITDIAISTFGAVSSKVFIDYQEGGTWKPLLRFTGNAAAGVMGRSFESGLRVPAGSPVRFIMYEGGGDQYLTLSGYEY